MKSNLMSNIFVHSQTVYDNNPEKIYAKFTNDSVAGDAVRSGQIVGSETPLWAEQVKFKKCICHHNHIKCTLFP